MRGKIGRFIIVPICTVFDDSENCVREENMKPITAYVGNLPDLKKVAKQLEDKANEQYFSKLDSKASKNR